jgi:hydrogenase expression/formation protein HypE
MSQNIITMAHGAGGSVMQRLIKEYIVSALGGSGAEVPLEALDDAAVIDDIVLKSDSYTVKPLFFPGGDIGRLAVSGTINDISVMGAEPVALASGFILEESFPLNDLARILASMKSTCQRAGVPVITGDTKVMERGALDKFAVNMSGIGRRSEHLENNLAAVRMHRNFPGRWLVDSGVRPGDKIVLSGTMGDHGVAVLSARQGYGFETNIASDAAPLNKMIAKALEAGGVVKMKDPTRGGLANLLNEWSEKSRVGILIEEEKIPMREGVRAACEMLGLDPLEIGNEGKIALAIVPEKAEEVVEAIRSSDEGKDAALVGEATDEFDMVVMETVVGGRRIVSSPAGDPVPRIC